MAVLRIVAVEDHLLFRDVIRKVCVEEFGHEIVGETDDGHAALKIILGTSPDIVLLDLKIPGLDGFAVIEALHRADSKARIIAVTSAHGDYTLFRVERAGVQGFLDKNADSLKELRQAIEAVGQGRLYFSASFHQAQAARRANPLSFDKVLSERERAVLALVGLALSDQEIASRLKISPKTVGNFRAAIMSKLKVDNTPKLVRYAIENGFTEVRLPADGGPAYL